MMIVGQHLSEAHLTHRVHGDTIHQAVRLIGTAGVEIQSRQKRLVRLGPHGHVHIG